MKTNIIRIAASAAIICVLLLSASCGSKKSASRQDYEPSHEQQEPGKNPLREAYASLASSYRPWTDVSMPVKLELKEPKRFSISGKASMVKGKSVYMSLRILGMEVGAVYIDNDSLYIVSKMQRMAYVESLGFFSRNFGFTLEDIQSMLLGQAFIPEKGTVRVSDERDFKLAFGAESGKWDMTPVKTPRNVSWHFEGSMPQAEAGIAALIEALIVNPASMKPMTATFADQAETPAGIVAGEIGVSASMSKRSLRLNVLWSLNRADWNKGISPSAPNIPASYRRITTKGLIDLLKKL